MVSPKTLIIARSEFMRRVTSRKFVILTLLGPLLIVAFLTVVVLIAATTIDGDSRTIALVDETGVLSTRVLALWTSDHVLVEADGSTVRQDVLDGRYDGYMLLPAEMIDDPSVRPQYFAGEGGGLNIQVQLEGRVERALEDYLLERQNVSPSVRDILDRNVNVDAVMLSSEGEEAGSTFSYSAIGYLMGMLMYITMLLYGTVVMYGAIEEKSTRVVEIIVSSVRPSELLMGKILGIGTMGLVQMLIWTLMIVAVQMFAGVVAGFFVDPAATGLAADASADDVLAAAGIRLPDISPMLFVWFLLYFLGGYLLYASIFAAVGILVESPQDAQSLMLPVILPIIVSIMFLGPVIESPQSSLAVALSMVPFTSPVLMVVRLAVTNVLWWEVLLSLALLGGGFLGSVWLSARIYRTGLLMYGKKINLLDVVRWFRYS